METGVGSQGRRHRRHRRQHHQGHQQQQQKLLEAQEGDIRSSETRHHVKESALDVPPPVFLPFQGKQAKLSMKTARMLASGKIGEDPIHSSHGMQQQQQQQQHYAAFSNCNPIIAFNQYIVSVALSTTTRNPQVCFHQLISSSSPPSLSSTSSSPPPPSLIEDPGAATPSTLLVPVITIPLKGSPIIAMAATKSLERHLTRVNNSNSDDTATIKDCVDVDREDFSVGHVVALSADGVLHVIECHARNNESDDGRVILLLTSWPTGSHLEATATCLAVFPRRFEHDKAEEEELEILRVAVGYQSGCIETWRLLMNRSFSGNNRVGAIPTQCLAWRGRINQPVLALQVLRPPHEHAQEITTTLWVDVSSSEAETDTGESATTAASTTLENEAPIIEEKEQKHSLNASRSLPRDLLVACLQQVSTTRSESLLSSLPSSTLLHVYDLASVENDWIGLQHPSKSDATSSDKDKSCSPYVVLTNFLVGPEAGRLMEVEPPIPTSEVYQIILSGSSRTSAYSSNRSLLCAVDDKDCSKCAAFLCNKAVAVLESHLLETVDSSSSSPTTTITTSWNLDKNFHPLVSSYAAVGCGNLYYQQQQHVAFCLRGGTVYLLPIAQETESWLPITIFPFPHELDLDSDARFVQGFTSGMLHVLSGDKNQEATHAEVLVAAETVLEPVVVYAWPGGLIDVFSCLLTPPDYSTLEEEHISTPASKDNAAAAPFVPSSTENESQLFQQLTENGSLKMLIMLLDRLGPTDPLLQEQPLWNEAQTEIGQIASQKDLTTEQLLSDKFHALCQLLLLLAVRRDEMGDT